MIHYKDPSGILTACGMFVSAYGDTSETSDVRSLVECERCLILTRSMPAKQNGFVSITERGEIRVSSGSMAVTFPADVSKLIGDLYREWEDQELSIGHPQRVLHAGISSTAVPAEPPTTMTNYSVENDMPF